MSTNISQFLHCSVRACVHACLLLSVVHCSMLPSFPLRYCTFLCNETPRHYPPCSLLTREGYFRFVQGTTGLSGASNLKDERVGHYLATWALSCPLARRQFNNAVQHVNSATSTQTTGEECKAAVEAYTASLLPLPPCVN